MQNRLSQCFHVASSLFPLPLMCVRESVCVGILFLSSLWGFRVRFPSQIHQEVFGLACWGSFTQTPSWLSKSLSVLFFQKHLPAPFNSNNTSHSLHGVPQGQKSQCQQKPPPKSPCKISLWEPLFLFYSSVALPWQTSPGLPPSAQSIQTRHERRLNQWKTGRSTDLSDLDDWGWVCGSDCTIVCMCMPVWVHSPVWFYLDWGREPHSCSSHPVSFL